MPLLEQFKTGPLVQTKFNAGEQAVVRIMIKQKKLTASEIAEDEKQALEKAKKEVKALAPHKRDASRGSHMSHMNESALSEAKSMHSEAPIADRWVEMD